MTRDVLLGCAACVGATLCYAISTTYLKKKGGDVAAIPLATASLVVASIAIAPFLPAPPPAEAFSTQVVVAVLGVSIVCSAFAFLLYFRLIADLGPTRTATVTFLIPVSGVLWGRLVLDEPIGASTIAGGFAVLAATALVVRR